MHHKLRSFTRRFAVVLTLSLGVDVALTLAAPAVASAAQKLTAGQKLLAGQKLTSPNGDYRLSMQADGNFVVYGPSGALWATGTKGANNYAIMQSDGNLVVYASSNAPLWNSGTWDQPGTSLVLQDDGNAVLYRSGKAVWDTDTWYRDNELEPGVTLKAGQRLISSNDAYQLKMQADGNLVLYGPSGAIWNSKTFGSGNYAKMQADGNLVVYSASNQAKWSSATQNNAGAFLRLQGDGNLVIYKGSSALWSSGTAVKPSILKVGETLTSGQARYSPDGKNRLIMQGDGNLVLYGPNNAVKWATNKTGAGNRVKMQTDGHLVVYDPNNKAVWWSGTAGNSGAQLYVNNNGTLSIISAGKTLWSSTMTSGPSQPPSGNILTAYGPNGCHIQVDSSIKLKVEALLSAAHAAGKPMCGWGWRSPESQIALRKAHCGTSHYAIYEMPASQCSPPTARPGTSQHEIGLAIDFFNGTMTNHTSFGGAQLAWMKANAATYGLKNLPSEAWHWSTTGK